MAMPKHLHTHSHAHSTHRWGLGGQGFGEKAEGVLRDSCFPHHLPLTLALGYSEEGRVWPQLWKSLHFSELHLQDAYEDL